METPSECGYVSSGKQKLHVSIYKPENASGKVALICDPLCEERRCALRTSVRLADHLSQKGICAVRFDYTGTGDSSGLHAKTNASQWICDIQSVARECAAFGNSLHIIALRASALLATAAAIDCQKLTLVAPLKSGAEYLHQLDLRNRVKSQAGNMQQDNASDFGGFIISQENRGQLETLDLCNDCQKLPAQCQLDIIVIGAGKALPPAWTLVQERTTNVTFIREMPFWGQTDYFESTQLINCF